MTIAEASEFFKNLKFTEREEIIAKQNYERTSCLD